jgi:hypothetical protein
MIGYFFLPRINYLYFYKHIIEKKRLGAPRLDKRGRHTWAFMFFFICKCDK